MRYYDVTVWDTHESKEFEDWTVESPPVRVSALDSGRAAEEVAGRLTPGVRFAKVLPQPFGKTGMFFGQPELGLVFQVEDSGLGRPGWGLDSERY